MEFLTTLLENGQTWYTFSFIIFIFIAIKFGSPFIVSAIDGRINQIKLDLEEAESLRVEAQEMLAQYQRKHRDAVKESERILKTAQENAERFKIKSEADFEETIKRRESQLEERLKRMEQNAINEIQAYVADLAMGAASQIITENLDKKTNAKLVKQSIENIEANIH